MSNQPVEILKRIDQALPSANGYEAGYKDALESVFLAMQNEFPKDADKIKSVLNTALDAYGNNVDEEPEIVLVQMWDTGDEALFFGNEVLQTFETNLDKGEGPSETAIILSRMGKTVRRLEMAAPNDEDWNWMDVRELMPNTTDIPVLGAAKSDSQNPI
jgi:hypothetical protein